MNEIKINNKVLSENGDIFNLYLIKPNLSKLKTKDEEKVAIAAPNAP